MGVAFIGIAFLIGMLAVVLACVIGLVVLWWKAVAKPKGSGEPSCGKCGYVVKGSSTLFCPECGSDYRIVGIVSAMQKRGVPVWLFLLLWTVLLPLPSCVGSGLLIAVGPKDSYPVVNMSLSPVSGLYQTLDINSNMSGGKVSGWQAFWGGAGGSRTWIMVNTRALSSPVGGNTPARTFASMGVDTASMQYDPTMSMLHHSPGATMPTSPQAFDESAAVMLIEQVTATNGDPRVMDEARELVSVVRAYPTQGLTTNLQHFTVLNNYNYTHDEPSAWWMVVSVLVWPALWVAGIVVFLVLRRRRYQRES